MESKNVKVIDEHGIDRDANVIFSIDVDGSDYVVYWIERDNENDNIFVSKLIKNIDNTSNMLNIEDFMEKGKISDIVKELIKYSIDNESDKLSSKSVLLPSGKNVNLSSVIINKEQNINVQKTYITTVKKSVVKVTSEYYDVDVNEKSIEEPVVDIFPVTESVVEKENETIIEPVVVAPEVAPVPEVIVSPIVETEATVIPTPVVSQPEVAPIIDAPVTVAAEPVVDVPAVAPVIPNVIEPVEAASVIEPIVAPIPTPVVSEPVVSEVANDVVQNVVEPVTLVEEVKETSSQNTLIFDASKETNLNVALGEVSQESKMPDADVALIREFGEDTPKAAPVVENTPEVVNTNEEVLTKVRRKAGFASNKFFIFVAVAFFFASCIFLGYEVYRYFQLS